MTAKRKAYELFCLFEEQQEYVDLNQRSRIAKQCALIAVDEMLNEYPSEAPQNSYEMERLKFWQEVKQEIEKL